MRIARNVDAAVYGRPPHQHFIANWRDFLGV